MAAAQWIMPDGSVGSLGDFLTRKLYATQDRRSTKAKTSARGLEAKWDRCSATIQKPDPTCSSVPTYGSVPSPEVAHLEAVIAERLGSRRRNRWMNERLLRELSGPLTATEMRSLFSPVPFGPRDWESPLTQLMKSENAQALELLRNIDMDKQDRVISRLEEETAARQASLRGPQPASPVAAAVQGWATVGRRARAAMRQAGPALVEELERPLVAFASGCRAAGRGSDGGAAASASELRMELADPFHRLIVHGLAGFHGLLSRSENGPDGTKRYVVIRQRVRDSAGAAEPLADEGAEASVRAARHGKGGAASPKGGGGKTPKRRSKGSKHAAASVATPPPRKLTPREAAAAAALARASGGASDGGHGGEHASGDAHGSGDAGGDASGAQEPAAAAETLEQSSDAPAPSAPMEIAGAGGARREDVGGDVFASPGGRGGAESEEEEDDDDDEDCIIMCSDVVYLLECGEGSLSRALSALSASDGLAHARLATSL
ncbi:unnamed protein product [Pedinophyceae sp. YPF-701]|nr:unnamed protein product [Pedinophyceae sp. YPF-701]